MSVKKISLDFYNNNVVTVYAKQSDANSRFVNITCTDYGKKYFLDPETVSAFIRYKKSDGNTVFNEVTVQTDGTLLVELTAQMLAVSGKQTCDIVIFNSTGINVETLNNVDSFNDLGVSVISTMTFYINVNGAAADSSAITSTSEFDALVLGIARLVATEKQIAEVTSECETATSDAITATNKANTATSNANSATSACKTATTNANTATSKANTATTNANNATSACKTATEACNTATAEAIEAAELCQSTVDGSGVVLKTNIANNLTTTTEGYVLDARQGNEIRLSIEELQELISSIQTSLQGTIDGLQKIHFNDTVDDSIGKNGDVLMVPIS